MKPLLFRVPTIDDRSFRIEQDSAPHFYGHLHFHPEIQLTLIKQGEGTLIVGDKIDRFCQYDILLLGANLPHVLRSDPGYLELDGAPLASLITVLFRPEHLEATMLSLPETKHLKFLFQEAQHGVRLRCGVRNAVTEQLEGMPQQRPFEQLMSLLTLLDNLATNTDREILSATAFARPQRPDDQRRLEQVFSYIFQQYASPIALDDVANVANLTPGAFCRFFRQHTRKTFSQVLNEVRIEHACRYLRESESTISQIAFTCGYTNLSNFNRQFKETVGMPPGDYIRSYRM
ncbi:AraC family transcriptional regulator [Spirosoma pollinicola]|uniref:AraC family transcriptional regulator n=1 Tax=Spirosoma pollinicola TaxID=2057025 RepID=A0A2K8Z1M9_9BACT|nr:AraC family transcriptional regulator [Spirosoma pollinicola]AUD03755.1 AraC family transcriptional regulator [Spirosoma pollinicola]